MSTVKWVCGYSERQVSMNPAMHPESAQVPRSRPTLAHAVAASRWGRLGAGLQAAELGGLFAVDLDLRAAWFAPEWQRVAADADERLLRIRNVWIPGNYSGLFSMHRLNRLLAMVHQCRNQTGLRHLIIPINARNPWDDTPLGETIEAIVNSGPPNGIRMMMGVTAASYGPDAPLQRERMQGLRRIAEEWDLDIALDITNNVPDRWEAEAIVAALGKRLAHVRLSSWIHPGGIPDRSLEGRISERTIVMLVDQQYGGSIGVQLRRAAAGTRFGSSVITEHASILHADLTARYDRMERHLHQRRLPEPR